MLIRAFAMPHPEFPIKRRKSAGEAKIGKRAILYVLFRSGFRRLIKQDVKGILSSLNDAGQLYRAMKHLILEPEWSARPGANTQKVRDKYAVDSVAQAWLDTFR